MKIDSAVPKQNRLNRKMSTIAVDTVNEKDNAK